MGSAASVSHSSKSSTSSNSSNSSNILSLAHSGLQVNIEEELSNDELLENLKKVHQIRVPFFDNRTMQTLANITYITGNGPFHEGLIFETRNGSFYIAQTYPVTFIMVHSYNEAINEIVSFCQFNSKTTQYIKYNEYCPKEIVTVSDIKNIVKNMPNEYNILKENCQKFCQKIIASLNLQIIN